MKVSNNAATDISGNKSSSSKKRRRRVTFTTKPQVQEIPAFDDYGIDRRLLWFTKLEEQVAFEDCVRVVENYMAGRPSSDSTRGLERYLKVGYESGERERLAERQDAMNKVLQHQETMRMTGFFNPKLIRKDYQMSCHRAVQQALKRAQKDEVIAQALHATDSQTSSKAQTKSTRPTPRASPSTNLHRKTSTAPMLRTR